MHPDAVEIPDGIDQDCDGLVDEQCLVEEEAAKVDEGGCGCRTGGPGPAALVLALGHAMRRRRSLR